MEQNVLRKVCKRWAWQGDYPVLLISLPMMVIEPRSTMESPIPYPRGRFYAAVTVPSRIHGRLFFAVTTRKIHVYSKRLTGCFHKLTSLSFGGCIDWSVGGIVLVCGPMETEATPLLITNVGTGLCFLLYWNSLGEKLQMFRGALLPLENTRNWTIGKEWIYAEGSIFGRSKSAYYGFWISFDLQIQWKEPISHISKQVRLEHSQLIRVNNFSAYDHVHSFKIVSLFPCSKLEEDKTRSYSKEICSFCKLMVRTNLCLQCKACVSRHCIGCLSQLKYRPTYDSGLTGCPKCEERSHRETK